MPEFRIQHITRYIYEGLVHDSANQIILYPVKDQYQEIHKQELSITGNPFVEVFKDYYGNDVGSFTNIAPHYFLEICSNLRIATHPKPLPLDNIFSGQQWNELLALQNQFPFIDYLKAEQFDGSDELLHVISQKSEDATPFQTTLLYCKYVYENFNYIPGITTVESTLNEVWDLKAGVCQDFAHILLTMLRLVNIPARYVSGYICPNKNGMRGEGATHAWVEAYLPNYGWLGIDPTNNCIANETHVRLAVGRNFSDCSPVKGVYKGAPNHKMEVSVSVSYKDQEDDMTVIPVTSIITTETKNSFQQYTEIMQQQQQQQ